MGGGDLNFVLYMFGVWPVTYFIIYLSLVPLFELGGSLRCRNCTSPSDIPAHTMLSLDATAAVRTGDGKFILWTVL